jgi:pyridoxine 5-phosphate synthase
MAPYQRLGVNIDHVATVRNARGSQYPDPVRAAIIAQEAGAQGITAHLREDRRHISDSDIIRLRDNLTMPLNMEMAATDEMLDIALRTQPNACCIVPEKRQEVTTEGGLDVKGQHNHLKRFVDSLKDKSIRVSLFVDPDITQIDHAKLLGADIIELHTGAYCETTGDEQASELSKIIAAAEYCEKIGIECHAGHGLSFDTVAAIAAIPNIVELNIGHFLISEAIFLGLEQAIKEMRHLMDQAREGL